MSVVLVSIAVLLFIVHTALVTRRQGLFTAESLFASAQMVTLLGAVILYEQELDSYLSLSAATAVAYLAAAIVVGLTVEPVDRAPIRVIDADLKPPTSTWLLLIASLVVLAVYAQAVSGGAFLQGLSDLYTGEGTTDIAGLRLSNYSGDEYFAPGFANLFKNTILPATVVATGPYLLRAGGPFGGLTLLALAGIATYALLMTGQRSPLGYFALLLIVYLSLTRTKLLTKSVLLGGAAAVAAFGAASTVLGREEQGRDFFSAGLVQVWKRVVIDVQESGIVAYRLVENTDWPLMSDWAASLGGLLPGPFTGLTIAEAAAASIGWRGTVPATLAGSAWANTTLAGAILLFAVLGACLPLLTRFGLRARNRTRLELLGIAGTFVAWGTWVAGGPEVPLLFGGIPSALLWWVGGRQRRRIERRDRQYSDPRVFRSESGRRHLNWYLDRNSHGSRSPYWFSMRNRWGAFS